MVTPKTKAILVCNPNNPTGAIATKQQLEAVLDIARKHNLVVLSDEIYDKLLFDDAHVPTATLANDVPLITFNGLSKAYLAPGWRVGWLVFNTPKLMLRKPKKPKKAATPTWAERPARSAMDKGPPS